MQKTIGLIALNQNEACGLRYLASYLKKNTDVHVCLVYYYDDDENNLELLNEFIRENNIKLVGVSVFSSLKRLAIKVTDEIKNKHNIPVIWGGPHVNSDPNDAIAHAEIIGLHDCEIQLKNLVTKYFDGQDITNTNNFWFKTNNGIIKNPIQIVENIDEFDFPDWGIEDKYYIKGGKVEAETESPAQNWYRVFGSRGCPYQCSYCANKVIKINSGAPAKYYRVRSVKNIMTEIEAAIKKFPNTREIIFYDELFGVNPDWFEEFCREYSTRIKLPFGIQSNPVNMNDEKIKKLKDIGLKHMSFGLQSASERMRKIYQRPETLAKIQEINQILHKHKIIHHFDVIVDNPLETKHDLIDTLNFLLTLKKPFLTKTFDLSHLPQTDLTNKLLAENYITQDDLEGNKIHKTLSWRVKDDEIDDQKQKFIITLIQLTGNVAVHNWLIKRLLWLENTELNKLKNQISKFILSEKFYHFNVLVNSATQQKKSIVTKKILKHLLLKVKKT